MSELKLKYQRLCEKSVVQEEASDTRDWQEQESHTQLQIDHENSDDDSAAILGSLFSFSVTDSFYHACLFTEVLLSASGLVLLIKKQARMESELTSILISNKLKSFYQLCTGDFLGVDSGEIETAHSP